MKDGNRRGFALVELVWGSCVLMLLVALQLPAIGKAREAARRSQCTNNLKQVALAFHNYHSVFDALPMSEVYGTGHGTGQGFFTQILPFMEQVAVYNAYNFALENYHNSNATAMDVKMLVYVCPSNREVDSTPAAVVRTRHDKPYPASKVKFGPSHYGANWGGVRKISDGESLKDYPGVNLGVIIPVVDPDAPEKTKNVSFRDIKDGTSNTLAVVEKRSSFGWGVGGWGGTEFDVYTGPSYMGDDAKMKRAFTGSYHPDVVVGAMCDGSVQSFRNTMDRKNWYGLTTRAGKEVIKFE